METIKKFRGNLESLKRLKKSRSSPSLNIMHQMDLTTADKVSSHMGKSQI